MYQGTRFRGNYEYVVKATELKKVEDDQIKQYYCQYCFEPAYNLKYKNKTFNKCPTCLRSTFTNLMNAYTSIPTIARIGCEMEGYFDRVPVGTRANRPERVVFHQDCSVHINGIRSGQHHECNHCTGDCDCDEDERESGYCQDDCYCGEMENNNGHSGEYVTDPIPYTSDLRQFARVVKANYPTSTNASCGGHFHISFNDLRCYSIAQSLKMYQQFCKALMAWATENLTEAGRKSVRNRITGHRYCEIGHDADNQVIGQGNRYHHFNFCYPAHQTMEVRILPMFQKADTYIKAVKFSTNWIDSFIKNTIKGQRPIKEKISSNMKGRIKKSDVERFYLRKNKKPMSFIQGGI